MFPIPIPIPTSRPWNSTDRVLFWQVAKAKANGLPHAYVVDIQNPDAFPSGSPDVDEKFDAVFSNATLHWCKRSPRGAIQSAKRVLKEGGRFVGEMGGFMNCVGAFRIVVAGSMARL